MNANPLIYVGVVVCTVGGFVLGFAYAIQTLVKKITDVVLSILPVNIPIITDRIANYLKGYWWGKCFRLLHWMIDLTFWWNCSCVVRRH